MCNKNKIDNCKQHINNESSPVPYSCELRIGSSVIYIYIYIYIYTGSLRSTSQTGTKYSWESNVIKIRLHNPHGLKAHGLGICVDVDLQIRMAMYTSPPFYLFRCCSKNGNWMDYNAPRHNCALYWGNWYCCKKHDHVIGWH